MDQQLTDATANVSDAFAAEVHGTLAFTRPADVSPDRERPSMLRAARPMFDADGAEQFALHTCRISDCAGADARALNLAKTGFEAIDLSPLANLQTALERVRVKSHIDHVDAAAIRHALQGPSFRLGNGKLLRVLFIAPEGLILRKAGPNDLKIDADEALTEMNGHGASQAVHSDQDVRGTPIRQLMRGAGPWLFRHEAPDGANRFSPIFLINIWIPLQQITRPLTLMDQRTVDRRRHQLRYALPTDSFLQRDADQRLNDIWTFLHDDTQRWYFTSAMDSRQAYIFNTLGTPHGSFILPGEANAAQRYQRLQAARAAVQRRDAAALAECSAPATDALPEETTVPLRRAIATMDALLAEAHSQPHEFCATAAPAWQARVAVAMDSVVRKSIELRAVAIVLPDVWPLNRI